MTDPSHLTGAVQKRWATPKTQDAKHLGMSPSQESRNGPDLTSQVVQWPTPNASSGGTHSGISAETALSELAKGHQIGLGAAAAMFPTPRAGKTTDEDEESWLARHAAGKVATPPLALAARMLPTPNASDAKGTSLNIDHDVNRGYLRGVVNLLPTPTGDDANNVTRTSGAFQSLSREVDGSLSPDWVSWLMGLPVGWTSLEPLPREEYLDWFHAQMDGTWWLEERGLPLVATGIKDRVNRLKCLGNGIVPASLALFLRGTR